MKRLALLFLALITFAVGCTTSEPDGKGEYYKNYIQDYFIADNLTKIGLYDMSERSFSIEFSGEDINYRDTVRFQPFAEKYNDLSYNKRIATPNAHQVLANELRTISVVSDADYDDLHPAGTPLNDIVHFAGNSFYNYIQSGYNDYAWNTFDKPLNELAENDLKLIEISCYETYAYLIGHMTGEGWFRFVPAPTISQEHNITLTITDAGGNTFSATKLIDFDDPTMWTQD